MANFRWGVIGPQGIANTFARGLAVVPDGELGAVASRTIEKAREYADAYGPDAAVYDDYDALIADPTIDAIYIAVPHRFHKELAIRCLDAGKPIMCEKPLTVNTGESEEVIAAAKRNDLFLMEAVWTRFLPLYGKIREVIDSGRIGEVNLVWSTFGFPLEFKPDGRWFNKDLAGGVLLDMGIYNVAMSQWVYGSDPVSVKGHSHFAKSGVDDLTTATMMYEGGKMAVFGCSFSTKLQNTLEIRGTKGFIHTENKFWFPPKATIRVGDDIEEIEAPFEGSGFEFEIMETQRCIRAGLKESPGMTWASTLGNMRVMDEIRSQVGIRYDWE
jgi:predicted dehydrogenase